jgi:hypothetical protein
VDPETKRVNAIVREVARALARSAVRGEITEAQSDELYEFVAGLAADHLLHHLEDQRRRRAGKVS